MRLKRGIILTSHALFIFFVGCGGDDPGAPPAAQGPLGKTPDIAEADKKLTDALNTCKSGIFNSGIIQALSGNGNGGTTYNDISSLAAKGGSGNSNGCSGDLTLALLLWKSARKQDDTLAINDPWYRKNLFYKVKGFINQAGAQTGLTPDKQQLLASILKQQFTSNVLSRASLSPIQGSLLRSSLFGYTPGGTLGPRYVPPALSSVTRYGSPNSIVNQQLLQIDELRKAAGFGLDTPPRP